ncbi:beta-class carbonic anhydrase [Virgibacillus halophilus]|uniref:carbonic anhydrase n=1 Tax=Tigheibacillus halophilus TaxID=361280 RepID=A0ABU5C9B9_9BACI|nr:carbonic anhydrase [Virgibacillus halophilus]
MILDDILAFNQKFVENEEYKPFETNNIPNKKMVILTCMDTRLQELLPKAMNIHNGDVKMLRNAGAIIPDPFDSIMRGILVAIYELQAEKVLIIGHRDCGMSHMDTDRFIQTMKDKGVKEETIQSLEHAGIHLHDAFLGFDDVEKAVSHSVSIVRNHPLLPSYVTVDGLVIDPNTGKLDLVTTKGE